MIIKPEVMARLAYVSKDLPLIYHLVSANPGISRRTVALHSGLKQASVDNYLDRLERYDLIAGTIDTGLQKRIHIGENVMGTLIPQDLDQEEVRLWSILTGVNKESREEVLEATGGDEEAWTCINTGLRSECAQRRYRALEPKVSPLLFARACNEVEDVRAWLQCVVDPLKSNRLRDLCRVRRNPKFGMPVDPQIQNIEQLRFKREALVSTIYQSLSGKKSKEWLRQFAYYAALCAPSEMLQPNNIIKDYYTQWEDLELGKTRLTNEVKMFSFLSQGHFKVEFLY